MRILTSICGMAALLVACGARAEDCEKLGSVRLAKASVTHAAVVASDDTTKLPYCRVQAAARPTADSDIRFELWIPLGTAWNGQFEQVGNGGFAGAIPVRAMGRALALGFAVAGTDDGHQSTDMTDAGWALHHDEKVKDYGWRAIQQTTLLSKQLLQRFKSRAAAKSFFVGCSDGGREALMMAQRFPRYFDGIVAGAPAFAMSRLLTSGAVRLAQLDSTSGHLGSAQLTLLQTTALKSCGHGAAYLEDPRQCTPDLDALRCRNGASDSCLTAEQIDTARLIYRQEPDPAQGAALYGVLPGAEAVKGSWDAWLTGTGDGKEAAGPGFTRNYLASMVMNDPRFDLSKVTRADLVRGERHYAPLMDADEANLGAFKAHGGKLIQYHGWNDPGIAPGYSLEYRARVVAAMGGAVNDFYRLYMVPGMLHCGGGDAPTEVDWQAAIEAWVATGVPPTTLVANDGRGGTQILAPFQP